MASEVKDTSGSIEIDGGSQSKTTSMIDMARAVFSGVCETFGRLQAKIPRKPDRPF